MVRISFIDNMSAPLNKHIPCLCTVKLLYTAHVGHLTTQGFHSKVAVKGYAQPARSEHGATELDR
jgi:hypothetical protein